MTIKEALSRFSGDNVEYREASISLLDTLGVKYGNVAPAHINIERLFPANHVLLTSHQDLVQKIVDVGIVGVAKESTFTTNSDSTFEDNDEKLKDEHYKEMAFFSVETNKLLTRPEIVLLTKAFNRRMVNRPVVLFICYKDKLTLATCERSAYVRSNMKGEKAGKISMLREINCSNLHAGHRQILERIAKEVTGCSSFDDLYEKWLKSFNIDVLSDAFFDGYKAIYEDIIEYVTGKRMVKEGSTWKEKDNNTPCAEIMAQFAGFADPDKAVRDYVKKLMGRLVFIQFLQRKGWMGVPAGDSWKGGDPEFLQNLFANSDKKDTFIDDVLEPLFNDLNTNRHGDLLTLNRSVKVPYLNGGLFELDDSDDAEFPLPSKYFWNSDKEDAKKHPGILQFFSDYNFTIDENAPDNVEIGVDPEMLGRIFENLLEDNKEKGAFYTPKEIVQYMCRESLIAYLTTCVMKKQGDDHKPEEQIRDAVRRLLSEPETIVPQMQQQKPESLEDFGKYIREVKICDPAIGSGAFPMGLLNELVHCRAIIGAWAKDTYDNLLVGDYAALKAEIICNNIYGVDIEKGAIDIARLRFWLSIIVDLKVPHALPNFDYKFMQGNSLITTFNGEYVNLDTKNQKHVKVNEMKKEKQTLYNLKQKYYTSQGEKKHECAVEIKKSILRLVSMQIGYELRSWYEKNAVQGTFDFDGQKVDFANIKSQLPQDKQDLVDHANTLYKLLNDTGIDVAKRALIDISFFDWRIMFTEVFDGDNGGFDIVIGNPPYIRQERLGMEYKTLLTKVFPTVGNGTADILVYFFGLGIDIMKKNAVLMFITSNKFLKTKYGKELRNTLASNVDVPYFIDFFELPVFHNASTDAGITNLINRNPQTLTKYFPIYTLDNLDLFERIKGDYLYTIKDEEEWKFIRLEEKSIIDKIYKDSISLGEFTNNRVYRGITTGLNKAFVLTDDDIIKKLKESESACLVKNYAKSTDIKKWGLKANNVYFLATGFDIDIEHNYPSAMSFLDNFHDELVSRCDQGQHYYNLRACAYYDEFEQNKLIYIHTAKDHQFYYDTEGRYINNSCYMIVCDSKYLFSFLNSKLFKFLKRIKFVAYGDGENSGRCKLDFNKMITVPLKRDVDESLFESDVEKANNRLKDNPKAGMSDIDNKLDRLVYELYGLTNAEVKIIDPDEITTGSDDDLFKA